jgi:hypothetical protein
MRPITALKTFLTPLPFKAMRMTQAERQGLLWRAEYARDLLDQAITALRDPDRDPLWTREWIDAAFQKLLKNEKSFPWLAFVRCVDHASRASLVNPNFTDEERATIARECFAKAYADLDAKLDHRKVAAAIQAWRTQIQAWGAIHAAVKDFDSGTPDAAQMAREWQDFHLPQVGGS